jgi:hypothetical protein
VLLFANMPGKGIVTVCFTHRFQPEYEFATDTRLCGLARPGALASQLLPKLVCPMRIHVPAGAR